MRLSLTLSLLLLAACADAQTPPVAGEWATDWSKTTIDLDELIAGGPPKDGIPAIDDPRYASVVEASAWIAPQEPVVLLRVGDAARAYPLQILTWHEIANDTLDGLPVAVTFCPLCYSAVAFDRRLDGETLSLGVSGLLRHSDMVMYDRGTESLWQQLSGEGIVGAHAGRRLTILPAQIVSFEQFAGAHPGALVLSRETGYERAYGRNPYAGYDDVEARPFLMRGEIDGRLPPMEKVVAVEHEGAYRAYPHRVTREWRAVHDTLAGQPLVVFHGDGAVSALDAARIEESFVVGTTGVFVPAARGRTLTFRWDDGAFVDRETGSRWDVTGRAVGGPLAGERLAPLHHGDYFAFAWFAFRPESTLWAASAGE